MPTWPSWGELTTSLIALAGGFGWWDRRRGRIAQLEADNKQLTEDLESAMSEATKALDSHQEALASKDAVIAELGRRTERLEDIVERRDQRIDALQDRLYSGGGRP